MGYASYIEARTYTEKVGLIDWRIGKGKKEKRKKRKRREKKEKKRKKSRQGINIRLEWFLFLFCSSILLLAPTSINLSVGIEQCKFPRC